jgi:hypothetical protein
VPIQLSIWSITAVSRIRNTQNGLMGRSGARPKSSADNNDGILQGAITPIVDLTSPIQSIGTQNADIETPAEYKPSEFKASLKAEGASNAVVQERRILLAVKTDRIRIRGLLR